jgi:hypothetical protein
MYREIKIYREIKSKMIECLDNGDTEVTHIIADELLCELLKHLGYDELIEIYEKVDKWYA